MSTKEPRVNALLARSARRYYSVRWASAGRAAGTVSAGGTARPGMNN